MKRKFYLVAAFALINCQTTIPNTDTATQADTNTHCGDDNSGNYFKTISDYLNSDPRTTWTAADCKLKAPLWTGDDNKGQVYSPLWHGAATAIEDFVPANPAGSCDNLKGTVRIDWDKARNTVHYSVKFTGLPRRPQIARTDGGDPEISDPSNPRHYIGPPAANWWFNRFHPAPKDFPSKTSDGTAFRLWTISTTIGTSSIPFFYSGADLTLQGSSFDFPAGPPAGTFAVGFPILSIVSSLLFYPNADGYAAREWTVPYDKVTGEGQYWSYAPTAFLPHNLCRAVATQPVLGQLRPYASHFRPASEGLSWPAMVRAGLFFDLTIEEGRPDVPPGSDDNNQQYIYSGLAFINNAAALQGGVPPGYHFSLPTAIQNVQPAIERGSQCGSFVANPHVTAPLYCQGQH